MSNLEKKPRFLDEELIHRLLSRFLDKIENDNKVFSFRIKKNTIFSELFNFDKHDEIEYLWSCIDALENKPYNVFSIELDKKIKPYDPIYLNAKIKFNLEKEEVVRLWLGRPVVDSHAERWLSAIEKFKHCFDDDGEFLKRKGPINILGKTEFEVVNAFAKLGVCLGEKLSLRELSGRCFWGNSKFLDAKEEYIKRLYPIKSTNLIQRSLLINVYLPKFLDAVLFVENQDSFLRLAMCHPQKTALIYTAGFKGAALRSRESNFSKFSYLNQVRQEAIHKDFEDFWYGRSCMDKVFFWGDLDLSGMSILLSLRNRFGNVRAWRHGYDGMVDLVSQGVCHGAELAQKQEQKTIEQTGCDYADEVLIPLISKQNNFVDQEAYLPSNVDDIDE